jgi:3alpha-hydroxysteroid 3-dehydrogenase
MRVTVVSGSASGIGAAVRRRLEAAGERVIGVDLHDADLVADLACAEGRAGALAALGAESVDGLVACAGIGPHAEPVAAIVSLNYFGAWSLLDGLAPALASGTGPAAVAVASNSAVLPGVDEALVAACLDGDEDEARRLAILAGGHSAYAGAKLALLRRIRRDAPAWAARGIRLNAVAPGPVMTPLLRGGLEHPVYGPAIRGFPVPAGRFGTPDEIAATIAFLLGPEATFCCGAVLFVDGGTDALLRPDAF